MGEFVIEATLTFIDEGKTSEELRKAILEKEVEVRKALKAINVNIFKYNTTLYPMTKREIKEVYTRPIR